MRVILARGARSLDNIPVVTVHLATAADVKSKLNGVQNSETVDRQIDGIVTNQLAVALFAHRVFLVEGPTESSVFYGVGDKTSIGSLEAAGLAIVSVGGKSSIPLVHAILTSIGIPVYALFDADGGFEARAVASGKCQKMIDDERRGHVAANRSALKYFGLLQEDFPSAIVSQKVAIFDDHLESFITANWAEWDVACKTVEADTGTKLSKNQLAYRTATGRATGKVPSMLIEILNKAQGK